MTAAEDAALASRLSLLQYPRSAGYNPRWALENLMGPNALWLAEALSQAMDLTPGMRVLDLGCGKAASSIFFAREFGVQVWAADLWIGPSENGERIQATDVADRVFPLRVEARELPFADAFFDAVVSLDAYHYFGTDDLYLPKLARLVKPGGQIGIVVPGLADEFDADVPDHLAPFWQSDFWSFHSPAWWERLWRRSGAVESVVADRLPDGWREWLLWQEVCLEYGYAPTAHRDWVEQEAQMLRVDAGRSLGFTRLVARRAGP